MKNDLLDYLNDRINEGIALKGTVRERGGMDTISGFIQAIEEVKEWVEDYDGDDE
jgi:hypothetical protein